MAGTEPGHDVRRGWHQSPLVSVINNPRRSTAISERLFSNAAALLLGDRRRCDTLTELGIARLRCLSAATSDDVLQHSINIRVLMSMVNCGRYPMPSQQRGVLISRR
jgi:hypothetical protein